MNTTLLLAVTRGWSLKSHWFHETDDNLSDLFATCPSLAEVWAGQWWVVPALALGHVPQLESAQGLVSQLTGAEHPLPPQTETAVAARRGMIHRVSTSR